MELKKYQKNAIEITKLYAEEARKSKDADTSFYKITRETYKPFPKSENLPFVCVKIPTGGGKTLVACHSINEIFDNFYADKKDYGLVVWFVPSEAIKTQTLKKLKDRKNAHREALDKYFDNCVRVFSNEEALAIRREDIQDNLCIIISILDAFRKEKKDKYKVYKDNGNLMSHFEGVGNHELEKDSSGLVVYSLANVIKLHNPLVVIDEGHRAKTPLSWETILKLNPSFIVEYTATPRKESNIIVDINSAELKEEKMVKIPIFLESTSQWQTAIEDGLLKRAELEKMARKEKGEYIRPVVLLQAQQEKEDPNKIYVGRILEFLENEKKIPRDEIAIKTASNNELENQDLFSKSCKIRYIITVNALAEGWDCSFAYILISVANIGSRISVEQIIGRIMRLPYAKEKKHDSLNYSYVFTSAKNFREAANVIIKGVEEHGYSREDVIDLRQKTEKREGIFKKLKEIEFIVPKFAIKNGEDKELQFGEDLIQEDFDISKEDISLDFKDSTTHDALVKLDIKEDVGWTTEVQMKLKFIYKDKLFSKDELVNWLDKRVLYKMLDKEQKQRFIEKIINKLLERNSLAELSVGRYILEERIKEKIEAILTKQAKKNFEKLRKEKKISKSTKVSFEPQSQIILFNFFRDSFEKHLYKKAYNLNKEEEELAYGIDGLNNVEAWYRNREKADFYIQGWKRQKFYPDFIVKTKKGNYFILEYKGKHLVDTRDSGYKEEIGRIWSEIIDAKFFFEMVSKDNLQDILKKISEN